MPTTIQPTMDEFKIMSEYHRLFVRGGTYFFTVVTCIWRLPENDGNFSIRWNMLKRYFSIGMESPTNKRREKTIWQRRFWEHLIRDEDDLHRCLDYIHGEADVVKNRLLNE